MITIALSDLSIAAAMLAMDCQRKDFEAAKWLSRFAGAATKFAKDARNEEKFIGAWEKLPPDLQGAVGTFEDHFPMLTVPEPKHQWPEPLF